MRAVVLAFAIILGSAGCEASEQPAETRFVIFNRLGPNLTAESRQKEQAAIQAHTALYQQLAREGVIELGGRLSGDPPLGISFTRPGVTREQLKGLLEEEAVVKGLIETEIREMFVQLQAPEGT